MSRKRSGEALGGWGRRARMETPRDTEGQGSTSLCRGGCGFYGSPAQEGLCSKCFKDALEKKGDPARAAALASPPIRIPSPSASAATPVQSTSDSTADASTSPTPSSSLPPPSTSASATSPSSLLSLDNGPASESSGSLPSASSVPGDLAGSDAKAKKKSRCGAAGCRAKLGLMGWDCRCGLKFCSEHRYSDQHNCAFDYQSQGKAELAKSNPKVVAAKIEKI